MELFWTPEAIQDRDDIYEYIEADNPQAAIDINLISKEFPPLTIWPSLHLLIPSHYSGRTK